MSRCAWCGRSDATVEQVEIQSGTYKTVIGPDGRTAKRWTRKPVHAWACGQHRGLVLDGKFKAPRSTRASGEGQGSMPL